MWQCRGVRWGTIEYARIGEHHVAFREVVGDERSALDIVMVNGFFFPMESLTDDPIAARLVQGLAELGRLVMFDRRGIALSDPVTDWETPLLEQWSEDNVRLHQFICDCAGMTLLPTMLQQVLDHWQRLRRHYLEDVMACTVQTAQAEHWQLLAALRTRNPEHVATVIHEHNQRALDTYIAHVQKTGDVTV